MLFINSLSFRYPSEPVTCYFSSKNDEQKKSDILKSQTLFPKEIKSTSLFSGVGGLSVLFTSYEKSMSNFKPVKVDFNDPDNEDYVKRCYTQKLKQLLSMHDDLMFTQSGITRDLQVWLKSDEVITVHYLGQSVRIWTLERYTLKVRYDAVRQQPYLLVCSDRPAQLLNVPLAKLSGSDDVDPFSQRQDVLTLSMVNKVMTYRKCEDGYVIRRIIPSDELKRRNIAHDSNTTRPVLTREMKHILGIDAPSGSREWGSKYVRYHDRITWFKNHYLSDAAIREVFTDLGTDFTPVEVSQTGLVEEAKRVLRFGGNTTASRPQDGVNNGPARNCPYREVRLFGIFHEDDKTEAANLMGYLHNGNYQTNDEPLRKRLSLYVGSDVKYVPVELQVMFTNASNPFQEISQTLQTTAWQNRDTSVRYVGIYLSPIHKRVSDRLSRECYYKVKELFLKHDIVTQCIDAENMKEAITRDNRQNKKNFIYTLQNMGVGICAKLGGTPWLLNEAVRKELIIGIGAFRTDGEQYIGAAFSFDNTGVLCNYECFRPSEFSELIGSIKTTILRFTTINYKPERLVIHYFKKLSMKKEARLIMEMLRSLGLDIPVYVVSINKTESEDLVLFDSESSYTDYTGQHQSLMPLSGCWVNLGRVREGYRYLLCNNTRYNDGSFRATDGFPFPVKLTINCFGAGADIDTPTIQMLISQVYQFSRIYWRSVRQQGLPVTIKYPEMVADLMPHFDDSSVFAEKDSLWFL